MVNIVLTGFMGAGKSAVGRRLAERLGMSMVDTDDIIEKEAGMRITEIFQRFGEERFRELEREVVKKVSRLDNHVIITGGGVVLNKENMADLRRKGVIIHLHADPEVIYNRVRGESHRPLLQVKDSMKRIRELLEYRAPFYADNDMEVDTTSLTVEEAVDEIVKRIEGKRG